MSLDSRWGFAIVRRTFWQRRQGYLKENKFLGCLSCQSQRCWISLYWTLLKIWRRSASLLSYMYQTLGQSKGGKGVWHRETRPWRVALICCTLTSQFKKNEECGSGLDSHCSLSNSHPLHFFKSASKILLTITLLTLCILIASGCWVCTNHSVILTLSLRVWNGRQETL